MAAKPDKAPTPEPPSEAAPKKRSKTPIIVAAVMVLEAVLVFGVVKVVGGKPKAAEAHQIEGQAEAEGLTTVEIGLVDEKFQNMQTGRVWIWDATIVLKVKQKNKDSVEKELERRKSEVKEAAAMIFRKATHAQLKEPGLDAIGRQLTALVNEVFGVDAEGRERVDRVLIPRCRGFPAD
ncbi:MAG: flagellar basal body-associated FliL family protein [Phycisphaerae bacterium]|nr:flagellar basal body-associated FliL family protein [Phycisphaerae bacterium]